MNSEQKAGARRVGTRLACVLRVLVWLLAACEPTPAACPDEDAAVAEEDSAIADAGARASDVLVERAAIEADLCSGAELREEVVLANVGAASVAVSARVIGDGASSLLAELGSGCEALEAGTFCRIVVRGALLEAGEVSATLELVLGADRAEVPIHAEVQRCEELVSVSPAPFDFGDVSVGVRGGTVTFTVARVGTGPSVSPFAAAEISGRDADAFEIVRDGCVGHVLGAAGRCPVAVRFSPTREGAALGVLTVRSVRGAGSTTLQGRGLP